MKFVIELTYLFALWLTAYVIGMTWGALEHRPRPASQSDMQPTERRIEAVRMAETIKTSERSRARHFLLISELSREGIRPDPPVRPVPIRLRLHGKPARTVL